MIRGTNSPACCIGLYLGKVQNSTGNYVLEALKGLLFPKQRPELLLQDRKSLGCLLDKLILINRGQGRGWPSWKSWALPDKGLSSLGELEAFFLFNFSTRILQAAKVSFGICFLSDRKSLRSPKLQAMAELPGHTEECVFFPEDCVSRRGSVNWYTV